MTNITLSIPEELHKKMKNFSEIKWSEIARKALEQRINDLEIIKKSPQKANSQKKMWKKCQKR